MTRKMIELHRRWLPVALLAGMLVLGPAAGATEPGPAGSGLYLAWIALQRQIGRSEGLIRDLEKQQQELRGADAANVAEPARISRWQREIDAERRRLAKLRADLERLTGLLP